MPTDQRWCSKNLNLIWINVDLFPFLSHKKSDVSGSGRAIHQKPKFRNWRSLAHVGYFCVVVVLSLSKNSVDTFPIVYSCDVSLKTYYCMCSHMTLPRPVCDMGATWRRTLTPSQLSNSSSFYQRKMPCLSFRQVLASVKMTPNKKKPNANTEGKQRDNKSLHKWGIENSINMLPVWDLVEENLTAITTDDGANVVEATELRVTPLNNLSLIVVKVKGSINSDIDLRSYRPVVLVDFLSGVKGKRSSIKNAWSVHTVSHRLAFFLTAKFCLFGLVMISCQDLPCIIPSGNPTVTTNVPMDENYPRGCRDWQWAEWGQELKVSEESRGLSEELK